ncbi:hypothetical protein ACVQ8P_05395 [Dellaglioa sp. BT-FLS60]
MKKRISVFLETIKDKPIKWFMIKIAMTLCILCGYGGVLVENVPYLLRYYVATGFLIFLIRYEKNMNL